MGYTPGVYLLISLLMSKLPDNLLIKCPHNISCKHSCNTRYLFRSQKPGFCETYENAGGVDSLSFRNRRCYQCIPQKKTQPFGLCLQFVRYVSRFPDTKKKEKSEIRDKIMHSKVLIFVKYRIFNSIKRVKYRI
jgi:hypothetical protein